MISLADFLALSLGILCLMSIGVLAVIGWQLMKSQRETHRRVVGLSSDLKAVTKLLSKDLAAVRSDGFVRRDALRDLDANLKRLAADVVQREVYRGGAPDHAGVAHAVRDADDVAQAAIDHGLSQSEVDLLVSLHGISGVPAVDPAGEAKADDATVTEV